MTGVGIFQSRLTTCCVILSRGNIDFCTTGRFVNVATILSDLCMLKRLFEPCVPDWVTMMHALKPLSRKRERAKRACLVSSRSRLPRHRRILPTPCAPHPSSLRNSRQTTTAKLASASLLPNMLPAALRTQMQPVSPTLVVRALWDEASRDA